METRTFSTLTFALIRHSATSLIAAVAAPFKVEIVTWGHVSLLSISSIVYNGPPIETAVAEMNTKYNGSIYAYHTVLANSSIVSCDDMVSQIDAVMSSWYYRKRMDVNMSVLIAAGCTEQYNINRLAAAWNLLMLTSVASDAIQIHKDITPTWVSMPPQTPQGYAAFLRNLVLRYNWTTIYIVVEESVNLGYVQIASNFFTLFNNISNAQVIRRYVRAINASSYDGILEEFRKSCRVLMFFGHATKLRSFMISAFKANMTSEEYVYVAVGQTFPYKPFGNYTWEYDDADDKIARQAFQNLLLVEIFDATIRSPSDTLRDTWIEMAKAEYNYTIKWNETAVQFLAAAYGSVEIFFQILNESLAKQTEFDYSHGKGFASLFYNRTFNTRFLRIAIDEFGQRRIAFAVKSLNPETNHMDTVMYENYGSTEIQVNGTIYWAGKPNSLPPRNEPICGYFGNKGPCAPKDDAGKIIGSVVGVFVVVCGILITVAYRMIRQRLQFDSAELSWIIDYSQLARPAGLRSTESLTQTNYSATYLPVQQHVWIYSVPLDDNVNAAIGTFATPSRATARLIYELRHISSDNINVLLGLSLGFNRTRLLFVAPFCERGSLHDLFDLQNRLDMDLQNSLAIDLIRAIHFIHTKTSLRYHGHLSRWVCLIDRHFTLKIGKFGYVALSQSLCGRAVEKPHDNAKKLLWTAPELLRDAKGHPDKATDIYSTGIILYEIFTLRYPYDNSPQPSGNLENNANKIIKTIRSGQSPYLRPTVDHPTRQLSTVMQILDACWNEQPALRPDSSSLLNQITSKLGLSYKQDTSFFDNILHRLKKYADALEDEVYNRTVELQIERKRCDELLCEILPRIVAERLRNGGKVEPEYFESVTVLFCDAYGFETHVVDLQSPIAVTGFLGKLYFAFDPVVKSFNAYKVETVASSYLIVSGLPVEIDNHVSEIASLALALKKTFVVFVETDGLQFVGGMHTGPCVAGVVGHVNPRYCLFGDTVNTASRMQSYSLPGYIQLSAETADLLRSVPYQPYEIKERGSIDIKGKGAQTTYWLLGGHTTRMP
ncbi:receptor-type guanylate cyclase gcy-13-like [Paramacrobiotus metropolitanus]|uniref:receptor-type guanylate cyclase gcy-13-like n=1 Tax=Paramacrobiotus metropolitanus TaxID=2943436 RepID=UPI002445F21D|nr:receptor-type guanylate cyclase gcy-13-like [Paramacrobiotus metropolitanus]